MQVQHCSERINPLSLILLRSLQMEPQSGSSDCFERETLDSTPIDEVCLSPEALGQCVELVPNSNFWQDSRFRNQPGFKPQLPQAPRIQAFQPASAATQVAKPESVASGSKAAKAVEIARSVRRQYAETLHQTPELKGYYWNPTGYHSPGSDLTDNNCANFVSAILRKAKLMKGNNKTNVTDLANELRTQGWTTVQGLPKPGDVWVANSGQHVEMVTQLKDGKVRTIGANNQKREDGTVGQVVSERTKPEGQGYYLTPPGQEQ